MSRSLKTLVVSLSLSKVIIAKSMAVTLLWSHRSHSNIRIHYAVWGVCLGVCLGETDTTHMTAVIVWPALCQGLADFAKFVK